MEGIASSKEEADAQLWLLRNKMGIRGDGLRDSKLITTLNNALDM